MRRMYWPLAALLLPLVLLAQAPTPATLTPVPVPAQNLPVEGAAGNACPSSTQAYVNGSCVCAVYPVWDDGNGNYLYSAEICEPAQSCALTDVAYYWESALDYPKTCDPEGTEGGCHECDPMSMFIKKTSSSEVPGMASKLSKSVSALNIFPERVPHPDTPNYPGYRNAGRPRFGIIDEMEFLVAFNAVMDRDPTDDVVISRVPVVAKVMLVSVDPQLGRAPHTSRTAPPRRIVAVGYEIDGDEIDPDNDPPIIRLQDSSVSIAGRKREEQPVTNLSPYVQDVRMGLNRFLVILGPHREAEAKNQPKPVPAKNVKPQ